MSEFEELMENEEFVNQLMKEQSLSDIEELFKRKGIEITTEEAKIICDGLKDTLGNVDDSEPMLSEDKLEAVTGGAYNSIALYILQKVKKKSKTYGGGGGGGRGF